jgi:predicted transposase YbfD/YdcC
MQSTVLDALAPLAAPARRWSVPDLQAAFATVPDPRRAQGRRFPLAAVLTLAVAALLANHPSERAIAEWGADQDAATKRALGFPQAVTPHQSTIQRLFRRLDPVALAAALSRVFDPPGAAGRARGEAGVAVDGKAQRGRLPFAPRAGTPVHALTAFCHQARVVLAQLPITGRADKAEAELRVAPALLACLDWRGRVLTGDALLCQQGLCRQVLAAGGDYLLVVKANQPALHAAIARLFDPPAGARAEVTLLDCRAAETTEKAHGRLETRRLLASTDLTDYLTWPALAQVVRVERRWTERGATKRQVRYGITSLPPTIADADRLLALKRGHWQIENGLHYIKDEALGEDRSQLHLGAGPEVMACLRDAAVSLLHRAGIDRIAERLRHHSRHPDAVLALLGCPAT